MGASQVRLVELSHRCGLTVTRLLCGFRSTERTAVSPSVPQGDAEGRTLLAMLSMALSPIGHRGAAVWQGFEAMCMRSRLRASSQSAVRRWIAVPAFLFAFSFIVPATRPLGEPPLPSPGTAAQVAALVAASSKIQQLPSDLVPNLFEVVNDDTGSYYSPSGQGCPTFTKCVFGDTKATSTVVLFGDSHAYMWLPSLVPLAISEHFRLVLAWSAACPAATVNVWDVATHSINAACNKFRTATIKAIDKLKPELVLLGSRTTEVAGANDAPISDAVWKAGLETTIRSLPTKPTKIAVIGDITQFSVLLPDCLAAEGNHIQSCSTPDPNPMIPGHYAAEKQAAAATHATYINPQPWLCTTTCSPVIGKYAAYYNNNHVTATYAAYLASVFSAAITPLLHR
jgi:hypothetical protein